MAKSLETGHLTPDTHAVAIYKPDAIERGLTRKIDSMIAGSGLTIVMRRDKHLSPNDVLQIWPEIPNSITSRTVPYMTASEVQGLLVTGEGAVTQTMLEIKQRVRERYMNSDNPVVSVIHTTDCASELEACIDLFFDGDILV